MAGLRIEIGIAAAAAVDRAVPDANVRQAVGLVSANRDAAGDLGHVVVDAGVPAQGELRHHIRKAHVVSLMLSDREKVTLLPNGPVTTPDKFPPRLVPTTP